ncbi:MAG: translation initiation factor IF-2 subunit beta [Candidatus Aenigmarchaeota archaeon]|jgi:translation initiation factor 2 subunit 2|nr:translation initiation factor IF-2 subunit beta [Candidatus Aenigmarchaeota archaeon]
MEYEEMLEEALKKIVKKETKERFQIPQIESEIQGPKFIIKNFKKIAEYIKRDPKHFAKFLMLSLASSGSIEGETLVLNSKLKREVVQQKVEEYIKRYVFCKVCNEPDTKLIKEDRIYFIRCEACGASYAVK